MIPPAEIQPADRATWDAFVALGSLLSGVRYGPGRGLWDVARSRYLITYAPGRRTAPGDLRQWPNARGTTYPSLHCSSWTNLFLAWVLRRNELFTHAGNIPDLDKLAMASPNLQLLQGVNVRGYGDACYELRSDGSGSRRSGVSRQFDARELLDRARTQTLPTFMVAVQSTKRATGWLWGHHTVVWAVWDARLYRIAADGYKGAGGYSGDQMRLVEVTERNVGVYAAAAYRVFGVDDSAAAASGRPLATMVLE